MSDIFEIKSPEAFLRISGKEYRLADPVFPEKVKLQKETRALLKRDDLELEEIQEAMDLINKRMIGLYLPDMPKDLLSGLGHFQTQAIIQKVGELAQAQFGIVLQKVEVKKDEAT